MGSGKVIDALRRLGRDLGTPGRAALALIAAALLAHVQLVRPLEERIASLRADEGARSSRPRTDTLRPADASARLAAFGAFFQREETREEWLAKLHGLALASGLDVRQADYRFLSRQGRLDRYQVSLPVSAPYPRIRRFAEEALAELPVLSLDQFVLRRKRASDGAVEAELLFTLYLPAK